MTLPGNQLEILQTVAAIEASTSFEAEDLQVAEEVGLGVSLVRNILDTLAEDGYIHLQKIETLSGMAYSALLTSQGKEALKARV